MQSDSTTIIKMGKNDEGTSSDSLVGLSNLACAGTLTVTNIGTTALTAGDMFQIFSAAGFSGAFSATNLPPLSAGLGWNFNPASGVLSVIQTVAMDPASLSFIVGNGSTLALSWPADHTGWRLQVQTNELSKGLDTNWVDIVGASATNFVTVPINKFAGNTFYRLALP